MTATISLFVLALTGCATAESRVFVGTADDQTPVEISIEGDIITAEVGAEWLTGRLERETFQLRSDGGAVLDAVLAADLVTGSYTRTGELPVAFAATAAGVGLGEITQATSTSSTARNCYCSTVYHRVYCRDNHGSWSWTGSYC